MYNFPKATDPFLLYPLLAASFARIVSGTHGKGNNICFFQVTDPTLHH